MLRLPLAAVQRGFLGRLGQRGQDAVVANAQLRPSREQGLAQEFEKQPKFYRSPGAELHHVWPVGLFDGGLQRDGGHRVGGGERGGGAWRADGERGEAGGGGQRVALDPRFGHHVLLI